MARAEMPGLQFRARALLALLLRGPDGVADLRRMVGEDSGEYDGLIPAEEAESVLRATLALPEVDGTMAARLAYALPSVAEALGVDPGTLVAGLRKRFPRECSDGMILALEVMES